VGKVHPRPAVRGAARQLCATKSGGYQDSCRMLCRVTQPPHKVGDEIDIIKVKNEKTIYPSMVIGNPKFVHKRLSLYLFLQNWLALLKQEYEMQYAKP
jgi:hypothetical protein